MMNLEFKTALDAYSWGVQTKGWDKGEAGKFGKQQCLYAENVTPEGRDVFCVYRSNIGKEQKGKFKNTFKNQKNVLYEENILNEPHKKRIGLEVEIFAFDVGINVYVYLGVYVVEEGGPSNVTIYKKI